MIHKPVLLGEAIENLNIGPGDTVIDGTLGAGGHSMEILKKISPGGKLISIDWDEKAVENFRSILKKKQVRARQHRWAKHCGQGCPVPINNNKNSERFFPENKKIGNRGENIATCWRGAVDNYANLKKIFGGLPDVTSGANAILLDLGFSSDQIEDSERGFSFQKDGPLDMRYSRVSQKLTAADAVNSYSEEELADIFKNYGEERFARKIAREIVNCRKKEKITRTGELVKIISRAVPESYKKGKLHFATKIFQALRIEVNQELENLKKFLEEATDVLASGGRLAVISFHSLEDRIVKHFFQKESRDCVCPPSFPKCVCDHKARLKIITKKPITASENEIRDNPRARSAKMRVAEKVA